MTEFFASAIAFADARLVARKCSECLIDRQASAMVACDEGYRARSCGFMVAARRALHAHVRNRKNMDIYGHSALWLARRMRTAPVSIYRKPLILMGYGVVAPANVHVLSRKIWTFMDMRAGSRAPDAQKPARTSAKPPSFL